MELLKQKITEQGVIVSDQVLKLDGLLNHQVDPKLTMEMGKEFAKRFGDAGVTRVVTVESSGIAVAFATAYELGVPLLFARRKKNAAGRAGHAVRAGAFIYERHRHGHSRIARVY